MPPSRAWLRQTERLKRPLPPAVMLKAIPAAPARPGLATPVNDAQAQPVADLAASPAPALLSRAALDDRDEFAADRPTLEALEGAEGVLTVLRPGTARENRKAPGGTSAESRPPRTPPRRKLESRPAERRAARELYFGRGLRIQ